MRSLLLLSLWWMAAAFALVHPSINAQAARPNVLFLICDDLNCDLASYGHPHVQSPNIDRLASRGVRFTRAYCQYPLCGPSRASFMAGLYPDQTLIRRNAVYLRERVPNVQTIAQMFRSQGYLATRVGKIFHYNVPKHIGTGGHDDPYSWDFTFNPRGRDVADEDKIFSLVPGQFGGTMSWLAAEGTDEEQTDGLAAAQAIELLRQYAEDRQPFFLAVGLYRPHTPYVAPKKYFDLYPRDKLRVPQVPEGYLETLPGPARQSLTRKRDQVNLAPDLAKQAMQAYYASITFADAQVGRILDALRSFGLEDSTIVVFTSDHGYHMGEHGYWQKTTLFENAARVPLIFAGPGIAANVRGKSTDALAEMVDFYPTLAGLCDLPAPDHLAGINLQPVLGDVGARPRESALTQYANGYSVRTERYRYTEWGEKADRGRELYDHRHDTEELKNLAGDPGQSDVIDRLSGLLRARIVQARHAPPGVRQIEPGQTR